MDQGQKFTAGDFETDVVYLLLKFSRFFGFVGKMLGNAFLNVDAFAYVNDFAGFVVKIIDATRFGKAVYDFQAQVVGEHGFLDAQIDQQFGFFPIVFVLQDVFQHLNGGLDVAHGPVSGMIVDIEMPGKRVEAISIQARQRLSSQAQGTQLFAGVSVAQAFEFFSHKTVIKSSVVGYENGAFGEFNYLAGYFVEFWGIGHHLIIDSRQDGDVPGDQGFRIDQTLPGFQDLSSIMDDNGDLDDAVTRCFTSSCLNINYGVFFFQLNSFLFWATNSSSLIKPFSRKSPKCSTSSSTSLVALLRAGPEVSKRLGCGSGNCFTR